MKKFVLICVSFLLLGQFFVSRFSLAQIDDSYSYSTDFSQYQPGSDGSPEWFSGSIGWEVKEKAFWASDVDKNFAILDVAPFGKLHSSEAVLTCKQKTGAQWKIAGVVVYQNAENYWHFALVEQPDNMGGKRFVELVEMYNGKYSDIVSVNCYRNLDLERGVMTDGFETELAEWRLKAKRPLMITEWSFPALDAGLPCRHGAGQRVPTQKDRAFAFSVFQKLLFTTPFVVGSNYFMWVDQPAPGISSIFPEDSNYGLVDEQDRPYPLLTQTAAKLNPLVYDFHSRGAPDVSITPGKTDDTLSAGNYQGFKTK
jgi:hypothetical protein